MKDNIQWPQTVYPTHFNGRCNCIFSTETLHNPGWAFFAKIKNTGLEKKIFADIEYLLKETDWLVCRVQEGKIESACSPTNVSQVHGDWEHDWCVRIETRDSSGRRI